MIKLSQYFPTPKFLEMSSMAFDISDRSIKYGELYPSSKGLRLGRFGDQIIPSGIIESGKIQKEQELVSLLKNLRKKLNLKFVKVALPEEQMYLFNLNLPKSVSQNIEEAILLQLEEHIPLLASEAIFDYDILSETKSDLIIQVVAMPIIEVEKYVSVFKQAGITPISFELEGHAIARSVIPKGEVGTVMVVDFGETRTGISIANCGRVLFTSTFDVGGDMLTNMIAKNFDISFEEAEDLKKKYCESGESDSEDIFTVILNGLSVLRDELNKHFTYWQTHEDNISKKHELINRIIICGGNANIPGLVDYISKSMNVKVEKADVWVNIFDTKKDIPNINYDDSFGYATVLGLAMVETYF